MSSFEKIKELVGGKYLLLFRLIAVFLTALSQPLLAAPFSYWPVHWIAWLPFLWAIDAGGGKYRIPLALFGGTAANLMIFYWIVNLMPNFSNIPTYLSVILTTLLCVYLSSVWVGLALIIPPLKRVFPRGWVFLAPAVMVSLEFYLPQLFPYTQGVSHYQVIPIIQLSSITGVYGVTYLLFLSNTVLYRALTEKLRGNRWPVVQLGIFAIALSLTLLYGFSRISLYRERAAESKNLRIALIQANFSPRDHSKLGFKKVMEIYRQMSREAVQKGADWIVWSEGEFKAPLNLPSSIEYLKDFAKEIGKPILLGGMAYLARPNERAKFFNSAIFVEPSGRVGRRYDKMILVPFGEYMPFEKYLSFIYKRISWYSRYSPGKDPLVQELDGIPFSFLICYEAIYPERVRLSILKGAKLLVNITYDAWFGRTTAPYQHLMLAAIRSAEFGVPLVRLATTGSSTAVNALGKTDQLSPLFERRVLIYEVNLATLPSLYAIIGDLFSHLCAIFSVLALLFIYADWRKGRRK